ncbi:MAG: hypothetical protein WAW91_01555 [Candidatus Nanoperiomorbaceae bacterium]
MKSTKRRAHIVAGANRQSFEERNFTIQTKFSQNDQGGESDNGLVSLAFDPDRVVEQPDEIYNFGTKLNNKSYDEI